MERLTDKREADAQRKEYENRLKNGYPRNIPEERFLKLAAYEETGMEPEKIEQLKGEVFGLRVDKQELTEYRKIGGIDHMKELAQAEKDGRQTMRPIDADQLIDFIKFDERVIAPEEHTAEDIVMMIKTAPTIAPPPNAPLTISELREMDGEPVWVVQVNGELRPFWMLVDAEDESVASRLYCATFEDYGTEWLAYRRKPEEGKI